MILKSAGANLGLSHPYQMFWVTGALSSFLDNTPTYLVFLTTAGSIGLYKWNCHNTWNCTGKMLMAISWCSIYGSKHIHWKCSKLYG